MTSSTGPGSSRYRPRPWISTDAQAKKLREYLLRGGFLMCADTWGDRDWALFAQTMQRVFPDRHLVEVPNGDSLFHVVYDLSDRYGIPGRMVAALGHAVSERRTRRALAGNLRR